MTREGGMVKVNLKFNIENQLIKAANEGNPVHQYELGAAYHEGELIDKDDKKAFQWMLKSAEQGYSNAQFILGLMYCQGIGVDQSDDKTLEWWVKAAEQGNERAIDELKGAAEQGYEVAINYFKK